MTGVHCPYCGQHGEQGVGTANGGFAGAGVLNVNGVEFQIINCNVCNRQFGKFAERIRVPCRQHDEWQARCDYCRGMWRNGTNDTVSFTEPGGGE